MLVGYHSDTESIHEYEDPSFPKATAKVRDKIVGNAEKVDINYYRAQKTAALLIYIVFR
jgi:hypothetical protein